jgi:hypothetical protein
MRLEDELRHAIDHSVYSNIGVDDHHIKPSNIEVANTTLSVSPLPGGPNAWDISVPFDTKAVLFQFRSNRTIELAGAKAGLVGIATRSSLQATTASIGGDVLITTTAYAAIYSKVASALNLSHKVFSSAGDSISLTDAYLTLTGPSTRVLRLYWTNYSASFKTLNCWGELGLLG